MAVRTQVQKKAFYRCCSSAEISALLATALGAAGVSAQQHKRERAALCAARKSVTHARISASRSTPSPSAAFSPREGESRRSAQPEMAGAVTRARSGAANAPATLAPHNACRKADETRARVRFRDARTHTFQCAVADAVQRACIVATASRGAGSWREAGRASRHASHSVLQ